MQIATYQIGDLLGVVLQTQKSARPQLGKVFYFDPKRRFGFLKSATTGETRILFNMDGIDCRMIGYPTKKLRRITPHKDDLILFVPRKFRHGIKARTWALLKDKTRP